MWKKFAALAPLISSVFVAGCIGVSLDGYTKPVYAVDRVEQSAPAEKSEQKKTEENDAEGIEDVSQSVGEEAAVSAKEAAGAFNLADGTYEGEGTGYAGKIRVAVTVKDRTITDISILKNEADTASFFERAKGVIDRILQPQQLEVDTVSGATYSSRGIINAVKNALTNEVDSSSPQGSSATSAQTSGGGVSGKTIAKVAESAAYRDGTYYGTGSGFAGSGSVKVRVTVSQGRIASADITESRDTESYLNRAKAILPQIISRQTTNVDAVSGATYSSAGIIEAVRDALRQAAVTNASDPAGTTTQQGSSGEAEQPKEPETPKTPETPEDVQGGLFPYPEGIYFGEGEGFGGVTRVGIVIQDERLKQIVVISHEDDETFFKKARGLLNAMIEGQTTEVDAVSGATYSSEGLMEAVSEALREAEAAAKAVSGKEETPQKETPTEQNEDEQTSTGKEEAPKKEPEADEQTLSDAMSAVESGQPEKPSEEEET